MFVQLRGMYDYIIIDSAPVGMVSDTFSLARLADVTVYVVRADYTRVSDVRFVNDMSKNNRLPRISLVVNGTRTKKGYGYGYGQNERKR
jgi:Mrp family chromosome partitioning ATPase